MTLKELEDLRLQGEMGLDLSPGNQVCAAAYKHIMDLRAKLVELEQLQEGPFLDETDMSP